MSKIKVENVEINILSQNEGDFICLTDMVKAKDDETRAADVIKNWLRNRSTIEFLGTWEQIYNANFKVVEFDHFKKSAGLPTFVMSASLWVERTGAIGIYSKLGKNGGTYAHKDIAFEFGSAISPLFKLYLIKEYQRLKDDESKLINVEWDFKRLLSKVNYRIHTDAIKDMIVPTFENLIKAQEGHIYANEADMLNLAIFGISAKDWKETNPDKALCGLSLREEASIPQLTVLSNMESYNAILIKEGLNTKDRFNKIRKAAIAEIVSLSKTVYSYPIVSPHLLKYEQNSTSRMTSKQKIDEVKRDEEKK